MHKLFIFVALFVLSIGTAQAEDQQDRFPPMTWKPETIEMVKKVVRDNILPNSKKADGTLVGEETALEKMKPLVPADYELHVMNHAIFWGTVNWCNLSMKNIDFEDMMDEKKWNPRQVMYIGTLHGFTTGLLMQQLRAIGNCSDDFKTHLLAKYKDKILKTP